MPNPLMRRAANLGKRPEHRPRPIDPIPEDYEGDNNPYRGLEPHGVAPTSKPADPSMDYDNAGTAYVEYEIEPEGPEPIPVRVVTGDSGRQRMEFRVIRSVLPQNGTPVQILGAMKGRTKVKIANHNWSVQATVFIGPDPASVTGPGLNAWALWNQETLDLVTEGDVWAACVTANANGGDAGVSPGDARIQVLIEFPVDI